MKNFYKGLIPKYGFPGLIFIIAAITFFNPHNIFSQTWCVPTVTQTFDHGISNVTLNGTPEINRNSGRSEGYINTGVSTTLSRGASYTVSMSQGFGAFCDAGNLRVWIDFNRDYDFDDAGELVLSLNARNTPGPFTANFTVPIDAFVGTTRMRVADKMRESCGHIPVTACDVPPDPIGYHGEYEDYDIIISSATNIINISSVAPEKFQLHQNYPNPFNPVTSIKFDIAKSSSVKLVIYDLSGKMVTEAINEANLQAGTYEYKWNAESFSSGIYYYRLVTNEFTETRKMILIK